VRGEPAIDHAALRALMHHRYGLDVARLEFVPKGIDSWSYAAEVRDGSRVFLKLTEPTRPDAERRRGAELPLMAALADLGLRVPRPIADRDGQLTVRLERLELTVLVYLHGRTLEDESVWSEPLYARVAEVMAAIHGSTESVRHLVQRAERYELPFLPRLAATVEGLAAGASFPAGDHPTLAGLRDMLAPRAAELLDRIVVLGTLRDGARKRGGETVLCHTDLWGSNLLLDENGELSVVDWDGALLGPPEHDLFMFAGTGFFPAERFGWFLDRYERALRPIPLDADVFGFYFHRRNLEDIAEFVIQLTEGSGDDADLYAALGYTAHVIDDWPGLEKRIDAVRGLLRARAQDR